MARLLNPYQIAQAIRALDSRLLAIKFEEKDGQRRLIYHYEVAGRVEPFYVLLKGEPIASIAPLYPEAASYETELQQRYGIEFNPTPLCHDGW
ncbi:MAG: hypothetical protein R3C14_10805 [Caldilineaceae bacterium]